MNQPINQTLGFDASDAIRSLSRLSVALDVANSQLSALNKVTAGNPFANISGTNAAQLASTLKGFGSQFNTLGRNLNTFGTQGAQSVGKVTDSFNGLGQLLVAGIITRGFRDLSSAMEEAADDAREFELVMARTLTIADDADSIETLSASARQLAKDFGLGLSEVSEATFQTLQNDIGNTAESFAFLGTSAQLAIAQGAKLETAMNSLVSVQKVYGESAASAAANADTLFVAIDTGRLTLAELENRLGTFLPLGKELGLSFEQQAAAAAALTQTGLNTATATTQLRNVLTKLVRPTDALKDAFTRLGVASGQELVQSVGGSLPKALQALTKEFGNSEAAVANAFGTIRGQLGVLNLLGNESEILNSILEEFENKSGKAAAAFETVFETDAQNFATEMARLNDTLLELGQITQKVQLVALKFFNDFVGGAENVISVLAGASAVVATLGAASVSATPKVAALLGTVGKFAPLAAVFALLASSAADSFQTLSETAADAALEADQVFALAEKRRAETKAKTDAQIEAVSEVTRKKQLEAITRVFGEFEKIYAKDVERYQNATERIGITANRLAEDFLQGRKDLLSQIDGFIKGIDDRIKSGTDRLQSATRKLADFDFEQQTKGLDALQKSYAEASRAAQTAANAAQVFAAAGLDETQLKKAAELQSIAEAQASAALSTASGTDAEGSAAASLRAILNQGIQLEKENLQRLKSFDKERAEVRRDELVNLYRQEESLVNDLAKLNQKVDETGRRRTPEEFADDTKLAETLGTQLEKIRADIRNNPLFDQLGGQFKQFSESTSEAFQRGINQARFDFSSAVREFETQMSKAVVAPRSNALLQETFVEGVTSTPQGKVSEQQITRITELNDFVKKGNEQLSLIQQLDLEAANASQKFANLFEATNLASGQQEKFTTGLKVLVGEFVGATDFTAVATDAVKVALAAGQELIKLQDNVTPENIEATLGALDRLKIQAEALRSSGAINDTEFAALSAQLAQADVVAGSIAKKYAAIPTLDEQMKLRQADEALNIMNQNLGITKTAADSAKDSLRAMADQALQAAINSERAVRLQGGTVSKQAFGGVIHKAFGGDVTRGVDSQLVATVPGEMIVNARDSSRFFSELRAINAGQQPVLRDQGGSVTNVGDINVNISNTNGGVDGRQIADTLRREFRRRG